MKKRMMVVLLSVLSLACVFPIGVSAAEGMKIYDAKDHFRSFDGSPDQWFCAQPSDRYCPSLAHFLVCLARASYNKTGSEQPKVCYSPEEQTNIFRSYQSMGFEEISLYQYYEDANDPRYGADNCAFSVGYRTLSSGQTALLIAIRGSYGGFSLENMSSDWQSNFRAQPTEAGEHSGFVTASEKVRTAIGEYAAKHGITDPVYVITGHSRGAAIGNLLAKTLLDSGVDKERLYAYLFACPEVTTRFEPTDRYDCIFNINSTHDLITVVPGLVARAERDPQLRDALIAQSPSLALFESMVNDEQRKTVLIYDWYRYGTTLWFSSGLASDGEIGLAAHDIANYCSVLSDLPTEEQFANGRVFSSFETASVTVNGLPVRTEQPPVILSDRTMVPMRAVLEAMGISVSWEESTQTVTAQKGDTVVTAVIGENRLLRNGLPIETEVAAQLIDGVTMIPLRAVAEAFDCTVEWEEETHTVQITEKN